MQPQQLEVHGVEQALVEVGVEGRGGEHDLAGLESGQVALTDLFNAGIASIDTAPPTTRSIP